MKRFFFLTIALLSASVTLTARDFDVVTPSGHTIYCDVVQGGASVVGWYCSGSDSEPVHLVIPSHVSNGSTNFNVVAIGDSAFMGGYRLVSVELPSSVRRIGRYAFCGCCGLGSFAVPSTVDSIGQNAFGGIPNVEYTGTAQGAPWGAMTLNAWHEGQYYYSDSQKRHIVCCDRNATDATIPPSVTSIGDYAFYYCTYLSSVSIDSTIVQVGLSAFCYCLGLDSVYFNPQSSGMYVFSECHGLRKMTIGSTITSIPGKFCKNCTSLQDIVIPDNITMVSSDAFIGCTSLESAVLGSGLSETGVSMFEGCTSLQHVTLPDNLRYIRIFTFKNCTSLQEIVLPSEVNYIINFAFYGCSNVNRIVCMKNTVPITGDFVFDSIDTGIEVVVPCGAESLYRQDPKWQRFENIEGKSYYVVVATNNPRWGEAVVTEQPTCESDVATIEAIPEEGCRFVMWDDNNTDNPRQITYDGEGYVRRTAIFERSVGIETAVTTAIALRPNPARDRLTVERPAAGPATLEVFNAKGQKVLVQTSDQAVVTIDVSSLAAGSYLLRVTTAEGSSVRTFVVGK